MSGAAGNRSDSGLRFGDPSQERERLFTGLEVCPHRPPSFVGITLPESGQDLRMVFVGFARETGLRFGMSDLALTFDLWSH